MGVILVFEEAVDNTISLPGDEVSLAYHFTLIKSTMSCKIMRKSNAPIKLTMEPRTRLLQD